MHSERPTGGSNHLAVRNPLLTSSSTRVGKEPISWHRSGKNSQDFLPPLLLLGGGSLFEVQNWWEGMALRREQLKGCNSVTPAV